MACEVRARLPREMQTLRLGAGSSYVRVLQTDTRRRAMLQERLGRPLRALDLPVEEQIDIIAATLQRAWQPVPDAEPLRTGAEQAAWLREYVRARWEDLDRPCPEQTIARASVRSRTPRRVRRHDCGADPRRRASRQRARGSERTGPVQAHRSRRDAIRARARPRDPATRLDSRAARRRSRRTRPRLVRTARRAVRSRRGRSGSGPSSNGSRPGSSCCRCTIRSARRCSPSPTNGPQSELSASSSTRSGPPRREPASSTPSR